MSIWRGRLRLVALFGAAATGLLAAHELDYRFVVPDPAHRHDLLLRSGHGYLGHMLAFVIAAGVIAAFTAVALGFARARGREGEPAGVRAIAMRLTLVQSGGFVLLEAVERLLVGSPPDDRLAVITVVGIVVQALTAMAGALLLALLERVGAVIASLLAPPPRARHASRGLRPILRDLVVDLRFHRPRPVRGPPLLARA